MASRSAVPPQSATAYAAAAQVARTPGLRTSELAPLLNWAERHTTKALTGAKHGGLIGYIRKGGVARWYPADQMPKRLAELKAHITERVKRQKHVSNARQAMRLIDAAADRAGRRLSDRPEVTRQPATAPLPFECRAPASVFHHAGMLR